MTNDRPAENPHDELPGPCRRALLLLSLVADGAATPSQEAELAAHLPGCERCRAARAIDAAVRTRLQERADAAPPAWLRDFPQRTAARALVQTREARAQNRLLWISAAAAVLVAAAVHIAPREADSEAPARDLARAALIRHEIDATHGRK